MVVMDEIGIICVVISIGGMMNKLIGWIGDILVLGVGFWVEEWDENGDFIGVGFVDKMSFLL